MLKKRTVFSLLLLTGLASNGQAGTYACQFIERGGLHWESAQWKLRPFENPAPFFLKTTNGVVTNDSAASAVRFANIPMTCRGSDPPITFISLCMNSGGVSLVFSTKTAEGGISALLGAALPLENQRDSLSVSAFKCQLMSDH